MLVKDLIRSKRQEKGLTLRELSRRIGVSEATISRWETGKLNSMRHGSVKKLAEVLGLSPMDLLPTFKAEALPSPTLDLSLGERTLIERYRRLESRDQAVVNDLINVWLARAEALKIEKEE